MRRLLTWASVGVGGVTVLVTLAILLIPSLVNLERYRTLLAQRAGRALGRDVSMGALRVSFWGGIGAEAQGVRVGQAAGHGAEPFLAAEALRVRVQLLPLLRGQIKVTSADLERPRIRLVRGADGRWGVDDLLRGHPPPGQSKPPTDPPRPGKAPLVGGLLLSEVTVRQGEITIVEHPEQPERHLTLADVALTARQDTPGDPIDVTSRARLAGMAKGHVEVALQLRPGDKEGPGADGTVSFTGVEATDWGRWFPGGPAGPMVSGSVSGDVRLAGFWAHTTFAGSVDLTPTVIRIGTTFQKPAGEKARITFAGTRETTAVRVLKLTATCRDTTLEGTVYLPDMSGRRVSFTAASPRIDLDRLLAMPTKQTRTFLGVAWAASAPRSVGSTAVPPGVGVQGRLKIGELAYHGLMWNTVEADVRYEDGIIRLPDFRASFARGRLRGHGEVDLRPSTPRMAFTSRLEKAATEPLVKALSKGSWTLQSGLDFDGHVEFTGLALAEILGSAAGTGSVQLVSGRLIDYRPLDRLAELAAPILAAQGVRVRLNEFDRVSGHYRVENGILRTTDLVLSKSEGTVTAAGALGLLDSSLDFDVVAKFGRATIEAKVTGTTEQPIVILKLSRLQRRIENELDKVLPEGQSRGLKELFRGLFRQ
jgi:AsmA protein